METNKRNKIFNRFLFIALLLSDYIQAI